MKSICVGLMVLATTLPVGAQTWDNTGNNLLSGSYYFREVTVTANDTYAIYGTITFSNGTYTMNAVEIEAANGEGGAYTPSGTYSIAASGFGFISNSLIGSPIYGLVGANGVFVGSITEASVNDIFIAAPITSQGTGTLSGAYSAAYIQSDAQIPYDALLQFSSNGSGTMGNVNVTAYADSSTPTTQTINGVNYYVSNNAYVVTFPTNNTNLVIGQEYFYSSPDGSIIFGGSPQDFDMMVGVRTGSTSSFGGLYYEAGFQFDESQVAGGGGIGSNSFYGSFNASNGVILAHQRDQDGSGTAVGFTYYDTYPVGSGGSYTDQALPFQYIGGAGGTQLGIGIGPTPGISLAVPAPTFPGSGVYIYPTGIVNAASYAPFTAGISPGEMVLLYGTNLGPAKLQGAPSLPLPTNLANVKVLINNTPAPLVYVSSGQVAVIVPYEIDTSVAQFQVINNGQNSNVVTEFVNETTPGVFTQDESGFGYAAALHANGSPVTPDNAAQAGETVAVFASGLGPVFPSILDGVGAPSSPLSKTSNTFSADISGTAASIAYQGLAPGFAGLYQINITIPSGLSAGDNTIGLTGPDSYSSEAAISVADPTGSAAPAARLHKPLHKHWAMRPLPLVKRPATVTEK